MVEIQKAKSRSIKIDCINKNDLMSIKFSLEKFNIKSSIKKKTNLWRLSICGYDNLKKFEKKVGFFHPEKKKKLAKAILSYKNYNWDIPVKKKGILIFIKKKGKIDKDRNQIKFFSVKKDNLFKLQKLLNKI